MTETQILQNCRLNGYTLFLPDTQLERKTYTKVAKKLKLIGGTWNRKAKGFVFKTDPTALLAALQSGKTPEDPVKVYQYFPTPPELADHLVSLADIRAHETVLEPSAGQGALIEAILRERPDTEVLYCELMPTNRQILAEKGIGTDLGEDFLTTEPKPVDCIIANPPFSKNRDIKHIRRMFDWLKPGGTLVSLSSPHWTFAQEKACKDFRAFLEAHEADVYEVPQGAFKQSGTMVGSRIIVVRR